MPGGWSCFNSQVMSIFQPFSSAHYKPEFWYQDATFLSPFHRGTHIPEDLQVELAWLPGLTLRVTCQSSPACPSQSLLLAWVSLCSARAWRVWNPERSRIPSPRLVWGCISQKTHSSLAPCLGLRPPHLVTWGDSIYITYFTHAGEDPLW